MKIKFLTSVMLVASVAIVSCKGDKGELGPQGPQGPGAIYSNWTDINMVENEWDEDYPADEDWYTFHQIITAPKITADVVNKGAVLVFAKNSEGTIFNLSGTQRLGIADRYDMDSDGDKEYFNTHVATTYKAGELKLLAEADDWNEEPVSYLNETGASLRYVVIPGVEGGRIAELEKMTYKEIVKLYNVKD